MKYWLWIYVVMRINYKVELIMKCVCILGWVSGIEVVKVDVGGVCGMFFLG